MKKLAQYGFDRYSQFGEDGIIEQIFNIIGTDSEFCVEFGAWDGFHFANTANLWTNGWKGVLIEADGKKFESLVANTKEYDNVRCIHATVGSSGDTLLESILEKNGLAVPIDLLSIDIDGDDYYILSSLSQLRPRVIICEYNPTIPPWISLIPQQGNYIGCSASALVDLAESIGYRLVAMTDTNCFFVQDSLFHLFEEYETDFSSLQITKYLTYLISEYSGDYLLTQKPVYGLRKPSQQQFLSDVCYLPHSTTPPPSLKKLLGTTYRLAKRFLTSAR